MNTTSSPNNPIDNRWHRSVYVWFIIIVPIIAVLVSLTFAYVAFSGASDLVRDNYYQDGKTVAVDMRQDVRASQRGLKASIDFDTTRNELIITVQQTRTTQPQNETTLDIAFYHAILAKRDIHFKAIRQASGQYVGHIPVPVSTISGKYSFEITGNGWRLRQDSIMLPKSTLALSATPFTSDMHEMLSP